MPSKVVMTAEEMRRSLARMAHEIVERNKSTDNIILVGMRTRGVPLARQASSFNPSFSAWICKMAAERCKIISIDFSS